MYSLFEHVNHFRASHTLFTRHKVKMTETLHQTLLKSVIIAIVVMVTPDFAFGQYQSAQEYNALTASTDAFFGEVLIETDQIGSTTKLLVGAPGDQNEGAAYLYEKDGQTLIEDFTSPDPALLGEFGAALSTVPDLTGDGVPDILIGAPNEDFLSNGSAGNVYLYNGATGGLLRRIQTESPEIRPGRDFGAAIASISDLNGDGVPDILVGSPRQTSGGSSEAGKVYVFSGADFSTILTFTGADEEDGRFGNSIIASEDFVGNSAPDVVIGAPGEDITSGGSIVSRAGRVYVLDGETLSVTTIESPNATTGGQFGQSLSTLQTTTGPRLFVGAFNENGSTVNRAGKAYVIDPASPTTPVTLESPNPQMSGRFGGSLQGLNDLTGDGTGDVLVGAPFESVDGIGRAGRAYVFDGASGGLVSTLTSPTTEDSEFGISVAGIDAPVVGAPKADVDGTLQAGAAYSFAPAISLADGRDGEPYTAPSGTPSTNDNPVGRFNVSAGVTGTALESVMVSNAAATPTGVTSVELWTSTDNVFDPASDTEIASATYSDVVSFSSLASDIPVGGTYLFVVTDLDASAAGDYEPVILDETAISFSGGQLAEVNGAEASTFSDAFLSDAATPLPVELAQFTARALGNDRVLLEWSTLSETDNAGFYVQRTAKTGDESWSELSFVEGAGTSQDVESYQFTDTKLPQGVETITYRLRQVDVDGASSLTDPVTVSIRSDQGFGVAKTYPNPARSQVTVEMNVPTSMNAGNATLHMYDLLGRQVRTFEGISGSIVKTIPTGDLPSGTYFLRLEADGQTSTEQITIVR